MRNPFLGQEEPSVELQFIQYPKFPQEHQYSKGNSKEQLELDQNRVVIV
jgi:hypothetical protein